MLSLARFVLGLIGFLAGWSVSYWVYFGQFDLAGRPFLGRGAPFLAGLVIAAVILAATARLRHGPVTSGILGGVVLGSAGLAIGLVGQMVHDPEAGPAWLADPLLNAALGGLLGSGLGLLWWRRRARRLT
jgi:hypothetical protein